MNLIDILKKAGFKGEGLRMAYAIAMAESSGSASAHNPNAGTGDNSYGLFQINMLGAMGPERRRQYGLASNEALYDPLTNARVAYKMSHGGTNWGPWSTYGSGAYRDFYGGNMGGQVTDTSGGYYTGSGGTGKTAAVATVIPKLDKYELAEQYGLTMAMINSDKSLRDLFNEAVKHDYDATLFTAKLKNTPWWRTTPDDLRKYLLLKTGDPATWKQKTAEANFAVNQLAVSVGFSTQLNSKNQATKTLQQAVYSKLALGWSDARLKSFFAARVGIGQGANSVVGGEVGDVFNQLHELAYMNGMKYTNWYGREARNIVSGKSTIQAAEGNIRREAAAKYGAFADQIRAGQNVLDLAQPYIASVAQILELPATDIDLFNNHVSRAMTAKPNKDGSQYPLWRFETELRSDPLWRKTNNAREGMMSVARQVARDFGMAW